MYVFAFYLHNFQIMIQISTQVLRNTKYFYKALNHTCPRRFSNTLMNKSKELKTSEKSNQNQELSTTFTEKAKDSAKTGGYGLVIIAGLGIIMILFYLQLF